MRVIPTSTILCRTPLVGEGVPRSYRALGDAGDAIHMACPVLANTVEVKTSTIIL